MKHTLFYLLLFAVCTNAQITLEWDSGYSAEPSYDFYDEGFVVKYGANQYEDDYNIGYEWDGTIEIFSYSNGSFTTEATFSVSDGYTDANVLRYDLTGDNFPEVVEYKENESNDCTDVKFWDIKTNQCILHLEGEQYSSWQEYGDYDKDGKLNIYQNAYKSSDIGGKHYYEGKTLIFETNGNATLTGEGTNLPQKLHLMQNYPNPFNPSTTIEFDIDQPQRVNLEIYDMTGRKVKTIMERRMPAGRHELQWDGTDDRGRRVASGQYFYKLQSDKERDVKKMLLIK